jgi:hypothetical protein
MVSALVAANEDAGQSVGKEEPKPTLTSLRKEERGTRRELVRRQRKFPLLTGLPDFGHNVMFMPTTQRGKTAATVQAITAAFIAYSEESYNALMKGEDIFIGPNLFLRNEWVTYRMKNGAMHEIHVAIANVKAKGTPESEQKVRLFTRDMGPIAEIKLRYYAETADRAVESQLLIAEEKAHEKLAEILEPIDYKQYLLTNTIHVFGGSGVIYIVRKGRPTLAYRKADPGPKAERRYLGALCLHPIGYFHDSWAGAMCPTDEAIAHILMIRSDEHLFWKRAVVHDPLDPRGDL